MNEVDVLSECTSEKFTGFKYLEYVFEPEDSRVDYKKTWLFLHIDPDSYWQTSTKAMLSKIRWNPSGKAFISTVLVQPYE